MTLYCATIIKQSTAGWAWPFDYRRDDYGIVEQGRAEALLLLKQTASLLGAARSTRDVGAVRYFDFDFKEERFRNAFLTVVQQAGFATIAVPT